MKQFILIISLISGLYSADIPQEGIKAEMNQEWNKAISIYKKQLDQNPKRVDLWLRVSDIYAHENNITGVIDALTNASDAEPNNATIHAKLSQVYAMQKESKKAFLEIGEAVKYDPDNLDYQERYGLLAETNHSWDKAIGAYKKILSKTPNRNDLLNRIVDIQAYNKNLPGVIDALNQSAKLNPEDATVFYKLAQAYSMEKDSKKALVQINKALQIEPNNMQYLKMQALLSAWTADYAIQYQNYQKTLEMKPDDPEALLGLARSSVKLKNYLAAISFYKKFLSLDPTNLDVWLEMADREKSYIGIDAAVASLEKAMKINNLNKRISSHKATNNPPQLQIPILEYHCVGNLASNKYYLDPKEFDAQMRLLKQKGYHSVTPHEIYNYAYSGGKLPEKPVAITFDDGCKESYTSIYPILKKYQFTGEFYLITNLIGNSEKDRKHRIGRNQIAGESKTTNGYLTWPEVEKMAKHGMRFGSHTSSHPYLNNLDQKNIAYELLYSKLAMKAYANLNVTAFSYPFGGDSFNTNIHQLLKKYGYSNAVTAGGGIENTADLARYNMRRISLYSSAQDETKQTNKIFLSILEPGIAETYYQRAIWYGNAKGKEKDTQYAIQKALEMEPDNLQYLAAQAKFANWAKNPALAAKTYQKMMQIAPNDETLLALATSASWANELDLAAKSYKSYLSRHAKEKKVLMDYISIQSWRGNYQDALEHLNLYKHYFGKDVKYLETKASILSWARRPKKAFIVIDEILQNDPKNYNANYSKTVALHYANKPDEAIQSLKETQSIRPESTDNKLLQKFIMTQYRPSIKADVRYYQDSDDIEITSIFLGAEYVLDTLTRIYGGIGKDRLYAPIESGYAPVNGGTSIDHSKAWIGASHRFNPLFLANFNIGVTKVEDENKAVYALAIDWQPEDTIRIQLSNDFDYYLISPKAVSLDITKNTTNATLTWNPSLLDTVNVIGSYATFSDDNTKWGVSANAIRQLDQTQYWNFAIGASAILYGFGEDLDNGYYDPSFSQTYYLSGYGYWKISEDDGMSIVLSVGTTKDNNMDDFQLASSANIEGKFGFYRDWMLVARAGYSYNVQQNSGAYNGAVFNFSLLRRF